MHSNDAKAGIEVLKTIGQGLVFQSPGNGRDRLLFFLSLYHDDPKTCRKLVSASQKLHLQGVPEAQSIPH